jgi:kynureninase
MRPDSHTYALSADEKDELRDFRLQFHVPHFEDKECVYLTGNSLGLQPKGLKKYLEEEMEDWAKFGVEGHFQARRPWVSYHEPFAEPLSRIVGAKEEEVVAMGSLTANLHFLMASFYAPKGKRCKIICEKKAFPSDAYALQSQAKLHGLDPAEVIIEVSPRAGEYLIHIEDILQAIRTHGDELALVMIGGVNYYSGQVFDMKRITEAGHAVGAKVGFDLAHAVGNVLLSLHDWRVDFAAWCSYKYLNSGPGGVAGIYVHEDHAQNKDLLRLAGWWGHDKERRFLMEPDFDPIPTAESWQVSNAPVFALACHKAALDQHDKAGMSALRKKSLALTSFLEKVIKEVAEDQGDNGFEIITPTDPNQRGSQLSILVHGHGKSLFDALTDEGVIADWREPNVIRIAPVPIYNSFMDCYRFGEALEKALKA